MLIKPRLNNVAMVKGIAPITLPNNGVYDFGSLNSSNTFLGRVKFKLSIFLFKSLRDGFNLCLTICSAFIYTSAGV